MDKPPGRVALAGFYGYGNFGDDLMAVIFGRHLQARGVPFRVFRLCQPYAEPAALPVAHSVDALLEGADTLVWGGGGLLVSWNERRFDRLFPGVAEEFSGLVATARARRMRIVALSVGGSGGPVTGLTPPYRDALVSAASHITVRNPCDVAHLAARGLSADYYPDIAWQAGALCPRRVTRGPRLRIGLDLYGANLARQGAHYFIALLQAMIWRRPDCTFVLINSRNASAGGTRRMDQLLRGDNVERYRFQHLEEDLSLVASLDFVLSCRLHMAIVALGYGVPAVAVFPEAKTRLLFANLGLEALSCGHQQMPRLLRLLASRDRLGRFLAAYPHPDVERLARQSAGHLERLSMLTGS